MSQRAQTCVTLCYYVGQPRRNLLRLLDQMRRVDAGAPFDLLIVVNGGDREPLTLPSRFASLRPTILNRPNQGYNMEAWDVGWRAAAGYTYYLFLQSECFLKRRNWVADFEFRMSRDPGVGLLGELLAWEQKTWSFIRESTDRDLGNGVWPADEPLHPIDAYQQMMAQRGIDRTPLGTHLCSIILFTSRAVLEDVGGFPLFGPSYREAIGSEVAISRVIEGKGYRLSRIRDGDFTVIGHRQYTRRYQIEQTLRRHAGAFLRRIGLR